MNQFFETKTDKINLKVDDLGAQEMSQQNLPDLGAQEMSSKNLPFIGLFT